MPKLAWREWLVYLLREPWQGTTCKAVADVNRSRMSDSLEKQSQPEESYEALKERNKVLEEQLSAQEDMLNRTTNYLEELQQQLETSNEQLAFYSEKLEEKVKARTRALEDKNKALLAENEAKKTYQERLEKANEELNVLMYRASHDLRSPITNAIGLLQLLSPTEDDNRVTEYLSTTLNTMIDTVDSLHNVVYYQNQQELPVFVPIPDKLYEIFKEAKRNTGLTNAELNVASHEIEYIYVSHDLLYMTLYQLMKNSLRHSHNSQSLNISIRLTADSSAWYFEVVDNGPGIDSEIAQSIFNMFSGSQKGAGTGLGLYQCRLLLDKIGGSIELASNSEEGTAFAFSVPK